MEPQPKVGVGQWRVQSALYSHFLQLLECFRWAGCAAMALKLYSPVSRILSSLVKKSVVSLHAHKHTLVLELFISASPVLPADHTVSHVGVELDVVTSHHKHHMCVTVAAFQPLLPLN